MGKLLPRITGLGYALPQTIRRNDDPIFDWLKKHVKDGQKLFTGYHTRHVLHDGEELVSIMLPAAKKAMQHAGIGPADVDLLIGTGSPGMYTNPNELNALHKELGLPAATWVIPTNCEFSHYNAALLFADALLKAGRVKHVLICVGGSWTRNVSYRTQQSVSAADGAGAAVMTMSEDSRCWAVKDVHTITDSSYYGSMFTKNEALPWYDPLLKEQQIWTAPYFQITEQGFNGFKTFGMNTTPLAATALMEKQGLSGSDICLISHQASSLLMDNWKKVIQPAQYINTIQTFANMAPANIPVNLAWATEHEPFLRDNLVLLAIGPDMHANALLLQRGN